MIVPVLFIIFNRPEYTTRSFSAIRKAKPQKLYIAADSSRKDKEGEKELCEQTRQIVLNSIDWECEVKTLFQKENLGCDLGVSTAISWFFENEELGIILEDDCVANLSFFKFCEELLQKYKNEKRIWTIGGCNIQGISAFKESYSFIKTFYCWGWATWKDRWKYFSLNIKNLKEDVLNSYTKNKRIKNCFAEILWKIQNYNVPYSWATFYRLIGISHKALHVVPQKNMIKNIGNYGVNFCGKYSFLNINTYKFYIVNYPKNIKNNYKVQNELDFLYRSISKNSKVLKIPNIKNRKIFLWGTGVFAFRVLFLVRKYKITAFLDKSAVQEYLGYKVKQPEQILSRKNRDFFIFIASTKYAEEMAETCKSYGLKKDVDFWVP